MYVHVVQRVKGGLDEGLSKVGEEEIGGIEDDIDVNPWKLFLNTFLRNMS